MTSFDLCSDSQTIHLSACIQEDAITAHLFYGSSLNGFVSVIKGEGSSGDGASEMQYESS